MERQNAISSNVAALGYDPGTQTLEVEFHGGRVYQYYNVPQGVFDAFRQASSKGMFLNDRIKDRYPYSRV